MECAPSTGNSRDILSSQRQTFLLYWLPGIAIAVTSQPTFSVGLRTLVWTASLTTMGITCLVNAVRCHRVHCYATGPFFLVMAVVSLLLGLGVVSLGRNGWSFLGLTILVGCTALYYLPELFLGKYRKSRRPDAAHP
jgi:hypothetical protein